MSKLSETAEKINPITKMIIQIFAVSAIVGALMTTYANKTMDSRIDTKTQKIEKALENIAAFLELSASPKQVEKFQDKKINGLKNIILGDEWNEKK